MTPETDTANFKATDVAAALGLLTRLPIRVDGARAAERGARAAWAYPVVGLVVGLMTMVSVWIAGGLGLPVFAVAALAVLTQVVVTGAMHEDGLADCADGFWGGWDKARRLEIMKDSRTGAYGVLALVFTVLLRWAALVALAEGEAAVGVIVAAMVSRTAMVGVMHALPHARDGGLSRAVGRPPRKALWVALGIAGLLSLVLAGWAAFGIVVITLLATATVAAVATSKVGGQTGDVLGATQQMVEISVLLTLAAIL